MALRGTLTHWKTRSLAGELGISPAHALGLLEALWHTTAEDAPRGNIGRFSNQAIAMQMFTDIDPDRLIAALVRSGHLDESPEHRLIVHDWHEHADDATDNRVARSGHRYADGKIPRMRRMSKDERTKLLLTYTPCARNTHELPQRVTDEHEKPLPEPYPVPVPDPEPVPGPGPEPVPANAPPLPALPSADDEEQNIPDDLPVGPLGNFILSQLSIPHSYALAVKFADCVDLLARDEGCARGEAGRRLLERARDHPPPDGKWRFWLEDGSWKAGGTNPEWERFKAQVMAEENNADSN